MLLKSRKIFSFSKQRLSSYLHDSGQFINKFSWAFSKSHNFEIDARNLHLPRVNCSMIIPNILSIEKMYIIYFLTNRILIGQFRILTFPLIGISIQFK